MEEKRNEKKNCVTLVKITVYSVKARKNHIGGVLLEENQNP